MAQDEQSDQERCRVRLLRGGRKYGKERQRKYRRRTQGGETAQHEDIRRGGTRRRLHETGRRLRRSGSDGRGLARYSAYRSLPGGGLVRATTFPRNHRSSSASATTSPTPRLAGTAPSAYFAVAQNAAPTRGSWT